MGLVDLDKFIVNKESGLMTRAPEYQTSLVFVFLETIKYPFLLWLL